MRHMQRMIELISFRNNEEFLKDTVKQTMEKPLDMRKTKRTKRTEIIIEKFVCLFLEES